MNKIITLLMDRAQDRVSALESARLHRSVAVPENLSRDMDRLWLRYIGVRAAQGGAVPVNGKEYEIILNRRCSDPRAAAMYMDPCVQVLPDDARLPEPEPLTAEGRALSDFIISDVRANVLGAPRCPDITVLSEDPLERAC